MNEKPSQKIIDKRMRIVGSIYLCLCLFLIYGSYKIGGGVMAAAVSFAYLSIALFCVRMYLNLRQLQLPDDLAYRDRLNVVLKAAGGLRHSIFVIIGITLGTAGIIALGKILEP